MTASAPDPLLEAYIARRDDDGLRAIMTEHHLSMRSVARRILRRHDLAEDAVQEAFVRLSRDPSVVTGNLGGWLRTVTGNAALDLRRVEASRRRSDRAWADELGRCGPPGPVDAEVRNLIGDAIARLPDQHRRILADIYFLGRTQTEVAGDYAISQVAVHKRLRAALAALRWELLRGGVADCLGLNSGSGSPHACVAMPIDPTSLHVAAILALPLLLAKACDAGVLAGLSVAAYMDAEDVPNDA
jgi:RNA polymerase sigma-70 factor, ECF subfamily